MNVLWVMASSPLVSLMVLPLKGPANLMVVLGWELAYVTAIRSEPRPLSLRFFTVTTPGGPFGAFPRRARSGRRPGLATAVEATGGPGERAMVTSLKERRKRHPRGRGETRDC